jgi:hypothetical protein
MNVHIGLLFLQNNNFSDHPSSAKFKTQLTLSYYLVLTENGTQTLVAKLRVEVWPKISNLLIFTAKLHFQHGIVVACIIALKQLLENEHLYMRVVFCKYQQTLKKVMIVNLKNVIELFYSFRYTKQRYTDAETRRSISS